MFRASSLPIIRSFSTVHSVLVSFMQIYDDRFQAESGWNCRAVPSWLCLEAVIINLHETYQYRMYSRKTPDDGQRRCPKHVDFYNRIKLGYLMRLVGYLKGNVLKYFERRPKFASHCIRNVWLEAPAVCKVWQACSVSVCGLFCVVTFTKWLTCLREALYDCPAFADSPHLHVVFAREIKISPLCSTEEVKNERRYTCPCPCMFSRRRRERL